MSKVEFHGAPYRITDEDPFRRIFSYAGVSGAMMAEADGSVTVYWHTKNSPQVVFPPESESERVGYEDIAYDDSAEVIVKNFMLATQRKVDLKPGQVIRIGH